MFSFKNLEAIPSRELETDAEAEKGLTKSVKFDVYYRALPDYPAERIGHFYLEPMPGCCGVVVSTGSFIDIQHRNHKAYYFHQLKAEAAKGLGYSCMLATTQTDNFPQVISAAKNGWKFHPAFTNKRTGNQLTVMEKQL